MDDNHGMEWAPVSIIMLDHWRYDISISVYLLSLGNAGPGEESGYGHGCEDGGSYQVTSGDMCLCVCVWCTSIVSDHKLKLVPDLDINPTDHTTYS